MCERVTIIETLEKMNSNLERIATALERAYPPAISIAQEEMTEGMRPQLKRSELKMDYYDPVKRRWSSRYQCPRCGQITIAFRDDRKVWYRCEECGSERTIPLKDLGLFWGVL